jgi:hypothetical protein
VFLGTNGNGGPNGELGEDNPLAGEAGTWIATVGAPHDYPLGSRVSGTIFVTTNNPAVLTAQVSLRRGATEIGTGTSDAYRSDVIDYAALPFEFVTSKDIAAGNVLTLGVALNTSASWGFGLEDDHATYFTLGSPVTPDATLAPGGTDTWTGEASTNISDVAGCGGVSGEACSRRYIDVQVPPAGGTLAVSVAADIPAQDYDLYVYAPDGELIGSSANPGTLNPDTGDLTESISAPVTQAGVYTVLVVAYQTLESVYQGSATLT